MNRHAYLIIAHNDIQHLKSLVSALDRPFIDIYIHFDVKSYNKTKLDEITTKKAGLKVISEIDVRWGTYSIVQCELLLLEYALKQAYSYYHLLSGADYPIKPIEEIYEFFEREKKEYLSFTNPELDKESYSRIAYRHIWLGKFKSSKYRIINKWYFISDKIICYLQQLLQLKKAPYYCVYQKGAQWFSITEGFAAYVVDQKNNVYQAFHNTYIPDEMFLQTVIINSEWKNQLNAPTEYNKPVQNMRYIDWERGDPYILRKEDYMELLHSECMFARKFSSAVDSEIIKLLEERNIVKI